MILLSILRGLPLERLSILIPKASTIRLRNSSDLIGFLLKVIELLTWHTFPIPNFYWKELLLLTLLYCKTWPPFVFLDITMEFSLALPMEFIIALRIGEF